MSETMPDPAVLPRETGQEKATAKCPNCGAELAVIETPYGGTAPATCPKCYPAADSANARQQAAGQGSQGLQRQLGTPPNPEGSTSG